MKKFNKKIIPLISLVVFLDLFAITLIFVPLLIPEEGRPNYLILALLYIFLIVISIVYGFLYQNKSEYEFQESGVHVQRGVFFRKKSFLEYKNIHAINFKQNIIEKILGVARLMLDSGSTNTGAKAEIIIYESIDEVKSLMIKLENKDNNTFKNEEVIKEENNENLFNFTPKLKMFSFFMDIIAVIGLILTIIIISLIGMLLLQLLSFIGISYGFLFIVALIGGFILIMVSIVSLIRVFVHYYNFSVYRNERTQNIEINYGMFTSYHHTFKLNRIKAVIIKQSLLYMIFGYAKIALEVIGYDEDESNETKTDNYLIPICKLKDCDQIIAKCLGDFTSVNKENNCKSYFSLISWTLLSYFIIYLVSIYAGYFVLNAMNLINYFSTMIVISTFVFILISLITLLGKYLQYKFEGIGIDTNKITIYHGAFNRSRITLLNNNIIGISDTTTPLRNKKGIYSYNIHIKTNAISNVYNVSMLDKNLSEKLKTIIKY